MCIRDRYKAIYASCYIRSPVDLNNVYLKVGSDDGIKIFRDGQEIHYNHVLRGPLPDREAVGPLDFEAGQWYYFIVIIEENTGQAGFHFRFSTNPTLYGTSPQNDPGAINNLDIALRPPLPVIDSISKVSDDEVGPIFSRYDITWEDNGDMRTSDTITIYNDYNLWKSERTFWWSSEQRNTNFSVLATIYDNSNSDFDRYNYDGNWEDSLSTTDFTPENYTVLWGTPSLNALGIYISNIGGTATLDELYWAVDYDAPDIINLRPGNQTNLNNGIGGSSNNLEITFWEYIEDNVGTGGDDTKANETFSGIYNSLINPLIQTKEPVEASFFDLTANVTDRDGYVVEGVTVHIYNATSKEYLLNQTTDENGLATFTRLPRNNYTLNCTFQKYGQPEFPVRGDYTVSLESSQIIKLDNCNLTSLNLELIRYSATDIIEGADVRFYEKNATGNLNLIGTEISDYQGKVSFVWQNLSQSKANISVQVYLLGEVRKINNSQTLLQTFDYLNYTFVDRTVDIISVQTSTYNTFIDKIDPVLDVISDKYKGQFINTSLRYYYIYGTDPEENISNAIISYTITDSVSGEIKGSRQFAPVASSNGIYNISIDTNDPDLNLIAGGVTYTFKITASKPGITPESYILTFTLKEIWTNLTAS